MTATTPADHQTPRHRRPDPTPAPVSGDGDDDLEIWDQTLCAVRWLTTNARPDLTLQGALQEALIAWVGEQAALHHHDEAFPLPEP